MTMAISQRHQLLLSTLINLAFGVFTKEGTRVKLPTGKTEFGKTINNNPEKYFTDDVMAQLEQKAQEYFKYGTSETRTDDTEELSSE